MSVEPNPTPRTQATRAPWTLMFVCGLAALVLYLPTLRHAGLAVPDLDLVMRVSDDEAGRRLMPMDQVWGESLPASRPDLGMYRPVHGMLLRLQYEMWPGRMTRYHGLSVALLVLLAIAAAALIGRALPPGPGRWVAALFFAAHPFLTQSAALIADQNALLAALAWVVALLVYWRAADGEISGYVGAPLVALLYFVSAGAHEAGFLLPLGLLAVEALRPVQSGVNGVEEIAPRKKSKAASRGAHEPESVESEIASRSRLTPQGRMIAYGAPVAAVAILLVSLRVAALDGALGATGAARFMHDAPAGARIFTSVAAVGIGLTRMIFLTRGPSNFYPADAHRELVMGGWVALVALGVIAGAIIFKRGFKRGPVTFGATLAMVPLIGLVQFIPLSAFFSESVLAFALPGAAVFVGALYAMFHEIVARSASGEVSRRAAPSVRGLNLLRVMTVIAFALIAGATFERVRLWGNHDRLWSSEADRWPRSALPLTAQLINQVSRGPRNFKIDLVEKKAEAALKLAKPPQGDPIHQYLALAYDAINDRDTLRSEIQTALEAPGPHVKGYGDALGLIAMRRGFLELAERAFALEIERDPEDFEALLGMSELSLKRGEPKKALDYASSAVRFAKGPAKPLAYLRVAQAAFKLGPSEENFRIAERSLRRAIELNPRLIDAYLELARLYVANGSYQLADQTLASGRSAVKLNTYLELYKIQIDSLERQGREAGVYDFIGETLRRYPSDIQFAYYAADYLLQHNQWAAAREAILRLLQTYPQDPRLLYGMAQTGLELGLNPKEAADSLWRSLALNPTDPRALKLMEIFIARGQSPPPQLKERIERARATRQATPGPNSTAQPSQQPASASPVPAGAEPAR